MADLMQYTDTIAQTGAVIYDMISISRPRLLLREDYLPWQGLSGLAVRAIKN